MRSVMRIGAVVAGFVAASAVKRLVELNDGHLPCPYLGKGVARVRGLHEMAELMAKAPAGTMLVVLVG